MTTPIPAGRGRWRITLHRRAFAQADNYQSTLISEVTDARSRRLEQTWCAPAKLQFTLDGRSDQAPLVVELQTEVYAWRWDERSNGDIAMFHGIVTQSEDELTADADTVNFVAQDFLAILDRRYYIGATPWSFTTVDQDVIVDQMVHYSPASAGPPATTWQPGAFLPLVTFRVNPDGTQRGGASGQLRTRAYPGGTSLGQAIDDLAKVIGGFDYDIIPIRFGVTTTQDSLRIFYPQQGVTRTDAALVYGSTVAALTRSVNSGDYANYQRVIGNNGNDDTTQPQLFAEAWNADANNVPVTPVGLWQATDNAADVNIQQTLNDKAAGDLALSGLLVPSYSITMRPGAYTWGSPNMGDVVPLIVQAGRLNVNTTTRVLGIAYAVGDDGQEDVELTVGRTPTTFTQLLTQADRDVDALTRR